VRGLPDFFAEIGEDGLVARRANFHAVTPFY